MEPIPVPLATQSYKSDSLPVSSQRCVNMYAEKEPEDAKTPGAVLGAPGLPTWTTVGTGGIRGFNVMNGVLYVVSGSSLYGVTSSGVPTLLGNGIAGFGPVSMANNGFQVIIVNGVNGWVYAPSATYYASSAVPATGGSQYLVGDTVTIGGGTYSFQTVLLVQSVLAPLTGMIISTPGSYTVKPSNPIAQGSTSGTGTGATFNINWTASSPYSASSVGIVTEGSNYAIGDTITLSGGTFTTAIILTVTSVAAGAIQSVSVQTAGQYLNVPANPASQVATSGVGSGATFTVTFSGPPVGFTKISDPNFYPANTVTFFDEYFILDRAGTNNWFYSNILDGTTYSALDYESATVQSDYVVGAINQQENLLILGQKSIETWYDNGANDNPFARYNGATIERGCAAPYTALKEDNSVFFLGDDLVYYRLDGILLHRLSTHAIEKAWQSYSTVSDAFAYSYTFGGHKFIVVTFPSGLATWVFDIASGLWHERVSYTQSSPFNGVWRGSCSIEFNNHTLIGDSLSGQIATLSDAVFTEFGTQIIGLMDSPPIQKDRKRLFISCLELSAQVGSAVTQPSSLDPSISLRISRDQGQTYSTLAPSISMGSAGSYSTRLRWKKLGKSRDFRFRFIVTGPIYQSFMGCILTAESEE